MSIANRVFLLFGILMVLMLGSQWYMMRSITNQVSSELGKVAFSVAKDTASYFVLNDISWVANSLRSQKAFTSRKELKLADGGLTSSMTVIELQSPSVEVRINNQRTDNEIQLISGNRSTSIPLPRQEMTAAVDKLQQQMILSTLIILGVGLLLAAFLAQKLLNPIKNLADAASKLAKGSLGTQIQQQKHFTSPEIRKSIETFNDMSNKLKAMHSENQELLSNAHYKELGYISSGLAHSIRNPLNTLGLTLEQMAESLTAKGSGNDMVDSAYRQIKRIDNWVKTFMTFALGASAETTNIRLSGVIQSIVLESKQMRENVTISTNLSNDTIIIGIEAELHAIFHSLIVNAVEASHDGGRVELWFTDQPERVHCIIEDHGSGMSESIQKTLFKPHKTTKTTGSGMGLFMAQKLAENRYRGSIELLQSSTKGTKIDLQLQKQRKL